MRENHMATRERYWRDAIETGKPEVRADAELRLGRYLLARGNEEVGISLIRRASKSTDTVTAPRAAWALAEALHATGHAQAGAEEYSRAAALATTEDSPHVLLSLAARCAAYGEEGAAAGLYRRLLDEAADDQHQVIATAAYRLAQLEVEHRRLLSATRLIRLVLRHGDRHLRAHALSDLADLLVEHLQGEGEGVGQSEPEFGAAPKRPVEEEHASRARVLAAELYLAVIATEDADLAPRAAYLLAEMRLESGESIAAGEGMRAVVGSEHPVYASMAARRLRELEAAHSSEEVDEFLSGVLCGEQLALDSEHPECPHPLPDQISCLHPALGAGQPAESPPCVYFVVHVTAPLEIPESDGCGFFFCRHSPLIPVPIAAGRRVSALGWPQGGGSVLYRYVLGAAYDPDPPGEESTVGFAPGRANCESF